MNQCLHRLVTWTCTYANHATHTHAHVSRSEIKGPISDTYHIIRIVLPYIPLGGMPDFHITTQLRHQAFMPCHSWGAAQGTCAARLSNRLG